MSEQIAAFPNSAVHLAPTNVLLIEDDQYYADLVVRALRGARHVVSVATTAARGLLMLADSRPDIVVLDLGLPDLHGSDVLRMIRGISDVPVVVASGDRDELRVVQLLNAGADDYVTKPFSLEHLTARLAAVLRRSALRAAEPDAHIAIGGLRIDLAMREATLDGRGLDLNRKEFDLLAYLARNRARVVTKRELVEKIWGHSYSGSNQSVDVHISWLRRKLGETAARPRYLLTIRGVGVRLVEPP